MSADLTAIKRDFYRRSDVAKRYDQQRFGGAGGQYVNQRELSLVDQLLPGGGFVADVGCGTARVSKMLTQRGDQVVRLDASLAMLALCEPGSGGPAIQADAFSLPLLSQSCDHAVSIRLLFHFPDVRPLLEELRRVIRQGGVLVCDTYSWSPRSVVPVGEGVWGAGVSRIQPARFRQIARESGWTVDGDVACFFISPYLYRFLPLAAIQVLDRLEARAPNSSLCRHFWRLTA